MRILMSKLISTLTVLAAALLVSPVALAESAASTGGGGWVGVGAGLAIGLSAMGAGIGQGLQGGSAMEGIARNPQAAGKIQTNMIIALAFTEALALYGFAVAFLLLSHI
jgi:F-type H+-transporting ATPase subunit c